jgi:esterase/lipase superfamily enzyme
MSANDPRSGNRRRLLSRILIASGTILGALVAFVAVALTLGKRFESPWHGEGEQAPAEAAPPEPAPPKAAQPAAKPPPSPPEPRPAPHRLKRPPHGVETEIPQPLPKDSGASGVSAVRDTGGQPAPYVAVPVFYGTDRRPTGLREPSDYYGRDWKDTLELGIATVSIPAEHHYGEMERPSWLHLEFTEDPAKHIVLLSVAPADSAGWVAQFRAHLAATSAQEALVFVHGYNVSFDDAARRTAQMAYDLGLRGVPTMFSWPSKAGTKGYFADEATASVAAPHFRTFLAIISHSTGATHIHVLAHSMGSRVLGYAVRDIAAARQDLRLSQIILCAPDIDAREFRTIIAPAFLATAEHTTMYVSSGDRALKMSKTVHDYERAGQTKPHLVLVDGLDLVDASSLHTDFLGHSYCAETRGVLDDLFQLIVRHAAPADRNLRQLTTAEHLSYWRIP